MEIKCAEDLDSGRINHNRKKKSRLNWFLEGMSNSGNLMWSEVQKMAQRNKIVCRIEDQKIV